MIVSRDEAGTIRAYFSHPYEPRCEPQRAGWQERREARCRISDERRRAQAGQHRTMQVAANLLRFAPLKGTVNPWGGGWEPTRR